MPNGFDPTQFQLAMVLTAAGATVSAALIAAVILILKRVPKLGALIDADHEGFTAVVLSLVLVIYAYLATTVSLDPANAFAAFLAWVAIATLSSGSHDALAATSVGSALSGQPKTTGG